MVDVVANAGAEDGEELDGVLEAEAVQLPAPARSCPVEECELPFRVQIVELFNFAEYNRLLQEKSAKASAPHHGKLARSSSHRGGGSAPLLQARGLRFFRPTWLLGND